MLFIQKNTFTFFCYELTAPPMFLHLFATCVTSDHNNGAVTVSSLYLLLSKVDCWGYGGLDSPRHYLRAPLPIVLPSSTLNPLFSVAALSPPAAVGGETVVTVTGGWPTHSPVSLSRSTNDPVLTLILPHSSLIGDPVVKVVAVSSHFLQEQQ